MHRLALALGLLLTPVLATEWETGTRNEQAAVVTDANSLLKAETLTVVLNLLNGFEADAEKATHQHVTGTTMDVTFVKTGGPARFALVNPSGSIDVGATHTVRVKDNDNLHPAGTFTITVRADATVKEGGIAVGFVSVSRDVSVTVAAV